MRPTVILCLLSALMGSTVTILWQHANWDTIANAHPHKYDSELSPHIAPPTKPLTGAPNQPLLPVPAQDRVFSADEQTNIAVYDRVNRSVCNIDTSARVGMMMMFGPTTVEGSGSGWVMDQQGHIVTNHHVIDGSDTTTVTLYNGESFPARVVGTDPQNDIAVLKINAPADMLEPVALGTSSNLRVGQRVYAIGNPFGLERTMTVGIVSSLDRSIKSPRTSRMIKNIIQIDAALNQGNSGGPLLDSQGILIGMNTAIASKTGENTGVGFAVPVDTLRKVIPQLIQFGEVRRAWLGIELFWKDKQGLGVVYAVENGPAAKAGIRSARIQRQLFRTPRGIEERIDVDKSNADIVVAINGMPVKDDEQLRDILDELKPGQTVNVSVIRDEKRMDIPVKLGSER